MTGELMERKSKKPIVLQERDELIMALLADFRFLSRPQLQRLLDFPCTTRINIRLKKLFDHGYLSRFLPTINGKSQVLYFLGPKGIINVSENMGIDPLRLEKERKHIQDRKDLFLNHQLFLNEVRIAFTLAIKKHPQMSLERWIKERNCHIEFPSHQGVIKTLRPDGCLCLSYQKKFYSFFVEADCSTMTNGRIRSKAEAYLDYARSGLSEQNFGFKYFRVLIITRTEERLHNLKSTVEELSDRLFYFTTKDLFCQSLILDRIYCRAGRQGLFSLLEN